MEILHYNKRDHCWDPIGAIDKDGLDRTIEAIVSDKLSDLSKREARQLFRRS